MSDEPVRKFRVGSVTAAIWKNQNGGGHSVTLQRSYKDSDGKWVNSTSYYHSDVLCAIKALERAEKFIGDQP